MGSGIFAVILLLRTAFAVFGKDDSIVWPRVTYTGEHHETPCKSYLKARGLEHGGKERLDGASDSFCLIDARPSVKRRPPSHRQQKGPEFPTDNGSSGREEEAGQGACTEATPSHRGRLTVELHG